jgi:hypothetical protein
MFGKQTSERVLLDFLNMELEILLDLKPPLSAN